MRGFDRCRRGLQHLGQLIGSQEDRMLYTVDIAERGDSHLSQRLGVLLRALDHEAGRATGLGTGRSPSERLHGTQLVGAELEVVAEQGVAGRLGPPSPGRDC